jgi:hypothetical protein
VQYYSAIKNNDFLLFAAKWMEMEITMLSKISQDEKDQYHMFYLYAKSIAKRLILFPTYKRNSVWLGPARGEGKMRDDQGEG